MRISLFPRELRNLVVASVDSLSEIVASGSHPDLTDLMAWSEIKRREDDESDDGDHTTTDKSSLTSATAELTSAKDPLLSVGLPLGGLSGGNPAPSTVSRSLAYGEWGLTYD
jgi:hypothetical protein